jgi:hypothetical protein
MVAWDKVNYLALVTMVQLSCGSDEDLPMRVRSPACISSVDLFAGRMKLEMTRVVKMGSIKRWVLV